MFYETLTNLCKKKNISPTAILQKLGISTSKLTAWKKGSTPSVSVLILISEFFDVSIDYLVYGEDKHQITVNNNELSENELELLRVFNSLPTKGKIKLLNIVYEYEEEYLKSNS